MLSTEDSMLWTENGMLYMYTSSTKMKIVDWQNEFKKKKNNIQGGSEQGKGRNYFCP